jgi:PAS domain S-box-containing protein
LRHHNFEKFLLNKLTVTQKGILLVLLPVAFELFFVYQVSSELFQAQAELKTILKERTIIVGLNQINAAILRTMLLIFTPGKNDDAAFLRLIERETRRAEATKESLAITPQVSPEINEVCRQFDAILNIQLQAMKLAETVIRDPSIPSGRRNQHFDPILLLRAFSENRRLTKKIDKVEEQFQTRIPEELSQIQNKLLVFLGVGIATGCLLSFLLSRLFSRDITKRLHAISSQAQSAFHGKALSKPQDGKDEIAQLDKTLYQAAEQHRQSRLREQAILHNAADVICSLDARFRFVGVSAVAEKRWRRTEHELIGVPIANIIAEESIAETLDALKKIAKEGSGEFENRIALPEELYADFQWSVRWSRDEKRYFCTVHDVTELRAMQRLKERFLSIVSHDLRAPIMSIGISLNLLTEGKRGAIPEKAATVLNRAEASLSTLTTLVNELLDLDKLEAGKMTLNSSVVSVMEVSCRARDSLSGLAESAGIKVELPDADCAIWGDGHRLTQALTNLISNAIKFSPRDSSVKINIELHDELAEIQVIDQGPGVAESEKPHVFDKFKQTSVQSNLKGKGSGLGLAIVKAIAESHNGTTGVKDAPTGGSIFYLRLPRLLSSPESEA